MTGRFFHWLSLYRDAKAAARGPRPYIMRQVRKPLLRAIIRNIK